MDDDEEANDEDAAIVERDGLAGVAPIDMELKEEFIESKLLFEKIESPRLSDAAVNGREGLSKEA
jgi:hypothetical protein